MPNWSCHDLKNGDKWVTPNTVQYAHILYVYTQFWRGLRRRLKGGSYLSHSAISWHFRWISPSLGCVVTCVTPFTVMPSRNTAPYERRRNREGIGLNLKKCPPTLTGEIFQIQVILSKQLILCFMQKQQVEIIEKQPFPLTPSASTNILPVLIFKIHLINLHLCFNSQMSLSSDLHSILCTSHLTLMKHLLF